MFGTVIGLSQANLLARVASRRFSRSRKTQAPGETGLFPADLETVLPEQVDELPPMVSLPAAERSILRVDLRSWGGWLAR